jgi:hypothetical protein
MSTTTRLRSCSLHVLSFLRRNPWTEQTEDTTPCPPLLQPLLHVHTRISHFFFPFLTSFSNLCSNHFSRALAPLRCFFLLHLLVFLPPVRPSHSFTKWTEYCPFSVPGAPLGWWEQYVLVPPTEHACFLSLSYPGIRGGHCSLKSNISLPCIHHA